MRQHSGKKRLGAVLLSLALCLSLLPTAALAAGEGTYTYLDEKGKDQTCTTATVVESSEYVDVTWSGTEEGGAWYVVTGSVTISSRIVVTGEVHLILADDCTLTASAGINVSTGNSLTIYGQSEGTGAVTATADGSDAGIGGGYDSSSGYGEACGTVTINGGNVTATGNDYGAGICGGGGNDSNITGGAGGTVTISGGDVTATGGNNGAGIGGGGGGGGGTGGAGGTVTISGGVVTATGSSDGAGIGGGGGPSGGAGGEVTISGGFVTATGGNFSAGIGGDFNGAAGTFSTDENGSAVLF